MLECVPQDGRPPERSSDRRANNGYSVPVVCSSAPPTGTMARQPGRGGTGTVREKKDGIGGKKRRIFGQRGLEVYNGPIAQENDRGYRFRDGPKRCVSS